VDKDKLALLFRLQEQPVAPAAVLAEQVGISPPTARAWLDSLRKDQVYIGVQATLKVRRLGLEMDDFLVNTDSFEGLTKIEKFCGEHPYTSYRARVFGGKSHGMLLQFRQPDAARAHLERAFERMLEEGLVSEVRELPTLSLEYGSVYTHPSFSAWDQERMVWNFDWKKWWGKSPKKAELKGSLVESPEERIDLDQLDAQLLEEITKNARRKNTEILEAIGLDKMKMGVQQKVSSRLKRIESEVVQDYRLYINWTHFDMYNTPFIIAKTDRDVTARLIEHLKVSEFPFGSSIRPTPNGFVWAARLPSGHLPELVSLVWQISESYELLLIDYRHSLRYGLWAETFDEEEKAWRVDREFCLDKPLKSIGL
jgi:DNA-binding Lrp family transcriptional regulator